MTPLQNPQDNSVSTPHHQDDPREDSSVSEHPENVPDQTQDHSEEDQNLTPQPTYGPSRDVQDQAQSHTAETQTFLKEMEQAAHKAEMGQRALKRIKEAYEASILILHFVHDGNLSLYPSGI
jgi:flagellum-specific peptidoglycan hydrolase FlgJ